MVFGVVRQYFFGFLILIIGVMVILMVGPNLVYISVPLVLLGIGLIYFIYFGLPWYQKRVFLAAKEEKKREKKR